jgi:hypothetical protein
MNFFVGFLVRQVLARHYSSFECNGNEELTGSRLQRDYGNICCRTIACGIVYQLFFTTRYNPR